jgi:hypothetical protein
MLETRNMEMLHPVATPPSRAPRFSRSAQMVSCLRGHMLYSEKRARDMLFTAIECLLADRQYEAMMVARLTREASVKASLDAERVGYAFSNWNNAGKAVVNALISSSSLLDPAGQPIPFGVTANAAPVGSLREGYRDRTEAFLLEFLLRRLGDVTLRDHTALAHALFRQFDRSVPIDDLEDRVAILLALLADRMCLDGDRYVAHDANHAYTSR